MSKRINQPITMHTDKRGTPHTFQWQRQYPYGHQGKPEYLRVQEVVESWSETGEWWHGELEKDFYIVQTTSGGIFELYQDAAGKWFIYRVID